jgi:competence protein ComEC
MSIAPPPDPDDLSLPPPPAPWREFARAPLVPVAVAISVGLIIDRYGSVPESAGWAVAIVGVVVWVLAIIRKAETATVWLWIASVGLAMTYHHTYRHNFPIDDIGAFASEAMQPARVRGTLIDEPSRYSLPKYDPLVTEPKAGTSNTILAVRAIATPDGWRPASGRLRVTVEGPLDGLHGGDLVEIGGRLWKPASPSNPGERDYRSYLLDDRITAELRVKKSSDSVTRLEEGWRTSMFGFLGVVRGWGSRSLQESMPSDESGLAAALLLGDNDALDRNEWDVYVRTGVIHVLAISGQHLVILAGFVWFFLQILDVRRRHGAWIVMAVMIGYTLLTGARASAVRAAVMVCIICAGIVLRRRTNAANAFALAWIVVIVANPTDPFTIGCQLSFLSVFVLIWGLSRWLAPRPLTPAEQLIAESRSFTENTLRAIWRFVSMAFAVSLILGVLNAPMVLAWQNLVSPLGIVLGPPLILLTTVALLTGFALLLLSPFSAWLAWIPARFTEWSLAGCEVLTHAAEQVPGGWVYGPAPSPLWLIGFYLGVAGMVLLPSPWPRRCLIGLIVWVLLGLLVSFRPHTSDETRFTFLAVGHGGCVVIETADGRVILYDAGTTSGPDAVRRVVAPYLWHRGIQQIDEVFLSHADLDHFNGLLELMKRFPIGRITMTPTFADKTTPGVETALAAIDRRGIPRRIAVAGERFEAGALTLEVLHPPAEGPPGNENTRSMVLLAKCSGHTVLLTGDLEGEGQTQVRSRPIGSIDVMLAPHHGGKIANAPQRNPGGNALPGLMAAWAKPKLVISCQRPGPTEHLVESYGAVGGVVWDTPTSGAVTVRCHSTGVIAEAFRSGEVRVIGRGK